jgi:hypothetical protein
VKNESGPIMVFTEHGRWLVDYGSYVRGYHSTRGEAIDNATAAAHREKRELVIETEGRER